MSLCSISQRRSDARSWEAVVRDVEQAGKHERTLGYRLIVSMFKEIAVDKDGK